METIVVQHPWMENDYHFADVILPVNTKLEEEDIEQWSIGCPMKCCSIEEQAMRTVGESLSDYEAR